MTKNKFDDWFGVPRKEIQWYPTIDPAVCIGCGLCAIICGRKVYSYDLISKKPVVMNPYNCLVGCTTCANLCPVGAIEFPSSEMIREIIRKYKIFAKIKDAIKEKFTKELVETVKKYAYEQSSKEKETYLH